MVCRKWNVGQVVRANHLSHMVFSSSYSRSSLESLSREPPVLHCLFEEQPEWFGPPLMEQVVRANHLSHIVLSSSASPNSLDPVHWDKWRALATCHLLCLRVAIARILEPLHWDGWFARTTCTKVLG